MGSVPYRQCSLLRTLQEFIGTLPPSIERYKRVSAALKTSDVDYDALQAVVLMTFKGTRKNHAGGKAEVSKEDVIIRNAGHEPPESPEEARSLANSLTTRLQTATIVRLACGHLLGLCLPHIKNRFSLTLSDQATFRRLLESSCKETCRQPAPGETQNLSRKGSATHSTPG